ncbi:MAG TPA: hypothetical protein PL033_14910 [Candidatus Brocadiia bacterium]|nr:hypothetical protein [Candidatus Brocadiia bacterium]
MFECKSFAIRFALPALAVSLILGCGGAPKQSGPVAPQSPKPSWVDQPSGRSADGKYFQAVGLASADPNKAAQKAIGKSRARTEIGRMISTDVEAMCKDFMQSHRDYVDPTSAGSIEFVQTVSKSVSSATLEMSEVVDGWDDPATGEYYALVQIPSEKAREAVQEQMRQAAEANKRRTFKGNTDQVLAGLSGEAEKRFGGPPAVAAAPTQPPQAQPQTPAAQPQTPPAAVEKPADARPVASGTPKPGWIDTRTHPQYPPGLFWTAVGLGNTVAKAEVAGRQELAQQVAVEIKSRIRDEMGRQASEKEKQSWERYESEAELTAQQSMIATKVGASWSDGEVVYALVVMDLEAAAPEYRKQIAEHRKNMTSYYLGGGNAPGAEQAVAQGNLVLGFSNLKKAEEEVRQANAKEIALRLILKTLGKGEDVGTSPVELSAIIGLRVKTLSALQLTKDKATDDQRARPGEALKQPLKIRAVLDQSGKAVPVAGLPLVFALDGGKGDIETAKQTKSDGWAECRVGKLEPTGKVNNRILVAIDAKALGIEGTVDPRLIPGESFTYQFPTPKIAVFLVYQHENEKSPSTTQNVLIEKLTQAGFKIVDETEVQRKAQEAGLRGVERDADVIKALGKGADYIVFGKVNTETFGRNKMGTGTMFSVKATAAVRIIDVETGKVLDAVNEEGRGDQTDDERWAAREAVKKADPKVCAKVEAALKKYAPQ